MENSVDEKKSNSGGRSGPRRRNFHHQRRNKAKTAPVDAEIEASAAKTMAAATTDPSPENQDNVVDGKPKSQNSKKKNQKKKTPGPDGANIATQTTQPQRRFPPQKNNRHNGGNATGNNVDDKQIESASKNGKTRNNQRSRNKDWNRRRTENDKIEYPPYWNFQDCLVKYNAKDPNVIRGRLRVLPSKDAFAFCSCDRGSQKKDVLISSSLERNRALDGDEVFVELLPPGEDDHDNLSQDENEQYDDDDGDDGIQESTEEVEEEKWWQDDEIQVQLWDPIVPVKRSQNISNTNSADSAQMLTMDSQRKGRVVYIIPPKQSGSEIKPTQTKPVRPSRRVVGTLKRLNDGKMTTLLTCPNRSLPQFRLSDKDAAKFKDAPEDAIFSAKYVYGSWEPHFKWPPCTDVDQFGLACNVEDETTALLIENQVDHGEFPSPVLEECQHVVASGEHNDGETSGWKPTPEMYAGRRDYRHKRIFTIDPTTAKDLDDALHIEELPNGHIELGVHIADVSHFVQPNSHIDLEAQRRCTTVYLVDRTIPMLPRPLCEIACSLNENVERLAFSCVWRMNKDGSLVKGHKVWYGKSVIKSCARLDYATAQNIIDNKVAFGENKLDEDLWPVSRRPMGKHTIEEVAADVRLMHQVGMARRQLRFRNGALALNAVKLTFQLDSDRETPLLCEPYQIRDSNRLVEEYMLLANFLVAQRLITHAGGKALLRNHEPPLMEGLEKVAILAKEAMGFRIDITDAGSLQRSLNRLGRQCTDEVVLKVITEMLKLPMKPAQYVAAGTISNEEWAHFALSIPYYTHFTSPIRRYADVIVHRLLQASIDGEEAVSDFILSQNEIDTICKRCNDKKEGSRKAQERSDIVFLALYLRRNPLKSQMGVVISVGQKAFTVFVPSLGISELVYLEEHKDWISFEAIDDSHVSRRQIKLERTTRHNGESWNELMIKSLTKVRVRCKCQEKPPICVKLELEGPYVDE